MTMMKVKQMSKKISVRIFSSLFLTQSSRGLSGTYQRMGFMYQTCSGT